MKKILIVEDDKAMHEIYRDIFIGYEKEYTLIFALNPKEAYRVLNTKKIDLVVLDIIMEPTSGEEVYLKLRQDEKLAGKRIPVLIVSVIREIDLSGIKQDGSLVVLEKPVKRDVFLGKLKQLLKP